MAGVNLAPHPSRLMLGQGKAKGLGFKLSTPCRKRMRQTSSTASLFCHR
eukprot:SAG11_NODE_13810_length_638_cov_1.144712_1_plen_48_part_01